MWQADYNRRHFQQLYFGKGEGVESLKTTTRRSRPGRYSVDGEVTDWVKVHYNEARYGSRRRPVGAQSAPTPGRSSPTPPTSGSPTSRPPGRTDAQIKADMASFDEWDRYDYDGDGNFNESDGYIDHFQIVHAGGDQSDGDPQQGEDAIWAHRWYAYNTSAGRSPAPPPTRRVARRSATPASGSVTTPSSPRTAA